MQQPQQAVPQQQAQQLQPQAQPAVGRSAQQPYVQQQAVPQQQAPQQQMPSQQALQLNTALQQLAANPQIQQLLLAQQRPQQAQQAPQAPAAQPLQQAMQMLQPMQQAVAQAPQQYGQTAATTAGRSQVGGLQQFGQDQGRQTFQQQQGLLQQPTQTQYGAYTQSGGDYGYQAGQAGAFARQGFSGGMNQFGAKTPTASGSFSYRFLSLSDRCCDSYQDTNLFFQQENKRLEEWAPPQHKQLVSKVSCCL